MPNTPTSSWLQWGRRVNTAECGKTVGERIAHHHASMGPPREHGGMYHIEQLRGDASPASMGPPREHGGMIATALGNYLAAVLQWGRRVNTAECPAIGEWMRVDVDASMGPPREHGGMYAGAARSGVAVKLQWGRRVNTAECVEALQMFPPSSELQWGRRVNTAEWRRELRIELRIELRFNGAAA